MKEIIDAEFTPIKPGRSAEEIRRKRRRQQMESDLKFLLFEAGLMAVTACITALILNL